MTVVAIDESGTRSTPLTYVWTIDQTAPILEFALIQPDLMITNLDSLTASFDSNESVTLVCFLDDLKVENCTSPLHFTQLEEATHLLSIVGTDSAGNESDALEFEWTVDYTLPQVSLIMTAPTNSPTFQDHARFEFSSGDSVAFDCRIDGSNPLNATLPLL